MEQRSPDQLVEWAYDQFLEQAADMLAPNKSSTSPSNSSSVAPSRRPCLTPTGRPSSACRSTWSVGPRCGSACWIIRRSSRSSMPPSCCRGIRANTRSMFAGTASNRHKKRRPWRLFRLCCLPLQGRAAMALPDSGGTSRRSPRSWARKAAGCTSNALWVHRRRRRKTPARRIPGTGECGACHPARPCGPAGLAVHGGPLTYLGQGPAATETEPVLGPAVADAGTRHLIRRPAPGWFLRRLA